MSEKMKKEKLKGAGLYLLALIFITNPTVNIFDIFPDFIGYLIIAKRLSYGVNRAPYFEETKRSLTILSLVSLLKIPAFFVMNYSTSNNVGDQDIRALFSFTFAVIETVFLISFIKNIFSALFYLGERSSASSLIGDFYINKKRTRTVSTESLKVFTYAFAILKNAAYSLPEFLLLKRGVDSSEYYNTFNYARLYPYAVVILVPLVTVAEIILVKRLYCYVKSIIREGGFRAAIDGLLDENAMATAIKNDTVRRMTAMLTLFTAASVFTVELRFDNFNSVNLIPHVIYVLLLTVASYKLSKFTRPQRPIVIFGALAAVVSVIAYAFEIAFLDKYGYSSLVSSAPAKESFLTVIILFAVELLLISTLIVFISLSLSKYVVMHTGLSPRSERYTRHDAEYHTKTTRKVYIWSVISILTALVKLVEYIFRYFSKETPITSDPLFGTVTGSLVPWFGTVEVIFSITAICYSFYLFGILKDDTVQKYSEYQTSI